MDPWTVAFIVAGLLLMASEFLVPSLVGAFIGFAALMTAGLRGLGLVESVPWSLVWWSVLSLSLAIPFRPLAQRLVPGRSEARKDKTDIDTDRDSMGEVVTVVEDVDEDHDLGRIRFQGTTWQARSTSGKFRAGQEAQLVYRDGMVWIVEPLAIDAAARNLFTGVATPEGSSEATRKAPETTSAESEAAHKKKH